MALMAWKQANPAYEKVPACYAGRLDPMAEGKLLILLGDECKRQRRYHELDKEYEIEVLLDAGSDTGDALGLVEYAGKETRHPTGAFGAACKAELGTHMRPYPAYSSKTVGGKPLFVHALEGALGSIEIPEHEERIYRIRLLSIDHLWTPALRARMEAFLAKVPRSDESSKTPGADFRIGEVRQSWERLFSEANEREFTVLRLQVACRAGTYMRALAPRLGAALGTKALALSIRRTRIGRFRFGLCRPIDLKRVVSPF